MIRIVTDSTASIPQDMAEENGVEVVTMYVNRDGREYEDATMDLEEFYRDIYDMVDNIPKSSQPSQGQLEALFENIAEAGDEVCHPRGDRVDGERFPDDARRGDDDVRGVDPERVRRQRARLLGDLDTVRVAGVRVAAVADHGARDAVLKILFRNRERRAFDEI